MYDHIKNNHPEVKNLSTKYFEMNITAVDKDPLRRIVREAVKIRETINGEEVKITVKKEDQEDEVSRKITLINGKREYFLPTIDGLPKIKHRT